MTALVGGLRRRSEFLAVTRARRKWVTPGLILQTLKRSEEPSEADAPALRVGFTVSKKVGNAVARNRARRRLRAAAAEVLPSSAEPGYDYVIIGRRNTLDRPFDALQDDLKTALRRLDCCLPVPRPV